MVRFGVLGLRARMQVVPVYMSVSMHMYMCVDVYECEYTYEFVYVCVH